MLLFTEVIELKWLARKHSSNCHLNKVLSVFKFPCSLSEWGRQPSASRMSIGSDDAAARLQCWAQPHLRHATVNEKEACKDEQFRMLQPCGQMKLGIWHGCRSMGCKYRGNSDKTWVFLQCNHPQCRCIREWSQERMLHSYLQQRC